MLNCLPLDLDVTCCIRSVTGAAHLPPLDSRPDFHLDRRKFRWGLDPCIALSESLTIHRSSIPNQGVNYLPSARVLHSDHSITKQVPTSHRSRLLGHFGAFSLSHLLASSEHGNVVVALLQPCHHTHDGAHHYFSIVHPAVQTPKHFCQASPGPCFGSWVQTAHINCRVALTIRTLIMSAVTTGALTTLCTLLCIVAVRDIFLCWPRPGLNASNIAVRHVAI